jgi:uncharacterized FAD-dependent dehydrogenase
MPEVTERWDAIVVGGGPAGLFAAHHLATNGASVLLIEAGRDMRASLCPRVRGRLRGQRVRDAEKFRMQCARCSCLVGLGGAAFHFDTNLGYVTSLSRSKIERGPDGQARAYSGLERVLGDFAAATDAVREVYATMYRLGLARPVAETTSAELGAVGGKFTHVDTTPSQPVTVDDAIVVVDGLATEVAAAGGRILLGHRAVRIDRGPDGFVVDAVGDTGQLTARAAAVVVAVGKLGLTWVREMLSQLDVAYAPPARVDIGVRLESYRDDLAPLTDGCHNPKLTYLNDAGEPVRTFCVCAGGRIMQYQFGDSVVLDGQHCLTTPTRMSNLGILTTVDVPTGQDGTEYALDVARRVTRAGDGRPVVQTVAGLRGDRPPTGEVPRSTLIDAAYVDLRPLLGKERVADILGLVDRLNALHDGLVQPYALVAAPVVERLYPAIELSPQLESNVPGLYFVGDSSSKIIGVTYGAATGIAAARSILGSRQADGHTMADQPTRPEVVAERTQG